MTAQPFSLSVYFDGLCHLCSREIEHYRKQPGSEKIQFIDIASPGFDPFVEGLDPYRVHQVMHAKTSQGELRTGLDAFISIWEQLPKYHWAAHWARKTAVKKVLEIGYTGFAAIRPYLPRKKGYCESSPYCEIRKNT